MPSMSQHPFIKIYQCLYDYYGPQNWWPAETPLEMVVGAVLTQNTNWKNVEVAISSLKRANLLSIEALASVSHEQLASCIRSAGYYNLKTKRLKNLMNMLALQYDSDLQLLFAADPKQSRRQLLEVNGIGPETADSILLYGAGHAVFVVDAYTHRVFSRHLLLPEECSYEEIQETFSANLPPDASLFNEFHALIVSVAKEFCKKSTPLCENCPLNGF